MKVNRYLLHPSTIREIKNGHFWVTPDEFSEKISQEDFFFIGKDRDEKEIGLFINDPTHKKVKARLWSQTTTPSDFDKELKYRLIQSFQKREQMPSLQSRNHYYLCFGELDSLPGLHIIKLSSAVIIQTSAYFWKNKLDSLKEIILQRFDWVKSLFFHERSINYSHQQPPELIWGDPTNSPNVEEFGYQIKTHIGQQYDYGVYTDMASIRSLLNQNLFENKKILNLFCYTGAFTLFAYQKKASHIVSIDSFQKVLNTLKENLELNQFDMKKHQIIKKTAEDYLEQAKEKFDLIICDPPSSYSLKGKRKKSIDFYKKYLGKMDRALNKNGYLLLFLNTHSIKMKKFEEIVSVHLKNYHIEKKYFLNEDCPSSSSFIEGNYLKGLLLRKK